MAAIISISNLLTFIKTVIIFLFHVSFPSWLGKSSTSTFGNISLTEIMRNSIIAWKFNQKRIQECLFAYLHPKLFTTAFKLNSYLMSLLSCGLVTPSTTIFTNINFTKAIRNFPVVLNITEK